MLETHRIDLKIRDIIKAKITGATEEEIAERIGIHPATVKRHLLGMRSLGIVIKQPDQRSDRAVFSYKIAERTEKAQSA